MKSQRGILYPERDVNIKQQNESEEKSMKKRVISTVLALAMTLGLAACGEQPTQPTQPEGDTGAAATEAGDAGSAEVTEQTPDAGAASGELIKVGIEFRDFLF